MTRARSWLVRWAVSPRRWSLHLASKRASTFDELRDSFRNVSGLALLSFVPILLGGCAAHVALTKERRATIQTVSVTVSLPEARHWYVGAGSRVDPRPTNECLRPATRDLDSVVRGQFEAGLREAASFPLVVPEGGDATFHLSIKRIVLGDTGFYGGRCQDCGLFEDGYKPLVAIEGMLQKLDGTILWQTTEDIEPFTTQTGKHSLGAYCASQDLMQRDFAVAAQRVVNRLLEDLVGQRTR